MGPFRSLGAGFFSVISARALAQMLAGLSLIDRLQPRTMLAVTRQHVCLNEDVQWASKPRPCKAGKKVAACGGASISLSSNGAAATVPASVTVTAGQASATFTVNTASVAASTPVTITGSYGGVTKTAMLTVMPVISGGYAGRNVFANADWQVL